MLVNFGAALALGALMGLERELAHKEAGIRTSLMISGGASLFALLALNLPGIINPAYGGALIAIIANIVVGVGFLGAGIIIKTEERIHGLTTAATVWAVAAVGALAGVGLIKLAATAAIIMAAILYLLRKMGVVGKINPQNVS
jgi:putative Mg2+ transporter-C (MgtC) family protein